MPINDTTVVWDSNRLHMRGRKASRSLQIVKDMAVGEIISLCHDDVQCTVGIPNTKPACSLGMGIYYLNKKGGGNILYEYYHTNNKIAVVKRIK